MEDEQERDDIPAVRDALMSPGRLSRVLYSPPAANAAPDLRQSAQLVEFLWSDYQSGQLGSVVANLPSLIRDCSAVGRLRRRPGRGWPSAVLGGFGQDALSCRNHSEQGRRGRLVLDRGRARDESR